MAKPRKSSKASTKVSQSVETSEDAEKIASESQAELGEIGETETSDLGEEHAETVPDGAKGSDGSDVEVADGGNGFEAATEADSSPELTGKANAETIVDAEDISESEAVKEGADDENPDAGAADNPDVSEGTEAGDTQLEESEADEPQKESEPVETKPEPKPQTQHVTGSIWPAFLGGVFAAIIGFVVGRGDAIDNFLPESMQRPSIDASALEELSTKSQALTAQADSLAEDLAAQTKAQTARIDSLEAALQSAGANVDPEAVADLESKVQAGLASISERLDALEAQPEAPQPTVDAASSEAVAALEAALEDQKAQIAALAERSEAADDRAADEATKLLARAALTRVVTAVDSGQSFAPALSDLEEVTPVEVPGVLKEAADAGVPSMAALQDSFPDAARAGLAAARAEVPESEVSGIAGFFKRQLNVRSVVPREGDDPDAILSRAQAAVREGDLGTALEEMADLPEPAQVAMNDWLEAATARKAALDAANDLADSLSSN